MKMLIVIFKNSKSYKNLLSRTMIIKCNNLKIDTLINKHNIECFTISPAKVYHQTQAIGKSQSRLPNRWALGTLSNHQMWCGYQLLLGLSKQKAPLTTEYRARGKGEVSDQGNSMSLPTSTTATTILRCENISSVIWTWSLKIFHSILTDFTKSCQQSSTLVICPWRKKNWKDVRLYKSEMPCTICALKVKM